MDNTEVTPYSSVYLSQLSDSANSLKLLQENEIELSFKINCLFFDEVIINSASLLGNERLFSMMNAEPNTFFKMYELDFIRPLIRQNDDESMPIDLPSIAENLIKEKIITGLSPDKLRIHADLIQNNDPNFVTIDDQMYRSEYQYKISEILINLSKVYSPKDPNLMSDICEKVQGGDFFPNITSLYNYASEYLHDDDKLFIKKAAEFSAQHVNSFMSGGRLSVCQPLIPFVNASSLAEELNDEKFEFFDKKFEFKLALDKLLNLSMSDILFLRESTEFKAVRKVLKKCRSTANPRDDSHFEELQDCFNKCLGYIQSMEMLNKFERNEVIKSITDKNTGKYSNITVSYVNGSVVLVALSAKYVGFSDYPFDVITDSIVMGGAEIGGIAVMSEVINRLRMSSKNYNLSKLKINETNFSPQSRYNPKQGVIKK